MSKDKTTNEVALRLKKIYCLAGAVFCRHELRAGWEEIEALEAENERLREERDLYLSIINGEFEDFKFNDAEGVRKTLQTSDKEG